VTLTARGRRSRPEQTKRQLDDLAIPVSKRKHISLLACELGEFLSSLPSRCLISVTLVGALLAASTGIVGATVVAMGLLSLPTMMKAGYDPKLATGACGRP
jgi:TRAP-type mannitol/chloroaromatic compound transport system permease large subunit